LVAANSRFLLRVKPAEVPNLATRVMRLCTERLDADWQEVHGHGVVMVETFVDPEFYQGTCYKAGNWVELGHTAGYRRRGRDYYEAHTRPKRLFVKPLRKDARRLLNAASLPVEYAQGEITPKRRCRIKVPQLGSLFALFSTMTDPRRRAGRRYPLACILGICAAAVLSGARDYQAIADFAAALTKQQRRRLRCWRNPRTNTYEVPTKTTFWNVLTAIDPAELDTRLGQWLCRLDGAATDALAIDGKTVKGAWTSAERQLHLFSAFAHDSSVVYSQCAVDEKSNEITHVETLLDDVELDGKVVSGDAMHTQRRTAHYLVQERGADYLFTIKKNQPELLSKAQRMLPASLFFPEEATSSESARANRKPTHHQLPS
jgi:predicted transposase YbfD/YdcC